MSGLRQQARLRLRQQARRRIMRELDRCSERRCGSFKARPMRCYFNLVDAHETLFDHEGVEVEDLDQAHRLAFEAAVKMIRKGEADIAGWRGWQMKVSDASGTVLFTSNLGALLLSRLDYGQL
jgi:hypothetical protein